MRTVAHLMLGLALVSGTAAWGQEATTTPPELDCSKWSIQGLRLGMKRLDAKGSWSKSGAMMRMSAPAHVVGLTSVYETKGVGWLEQDASKWKGRFSYILPDPKSKAANQEIIGVLITLVSINDSEAVVGEVFRDELAERWGQPTGDGKIVSDHAGDYWISQAWWEWLDADCDVQARLYVVEHWYTLMHGGKVPAAYVRLLRASKQDAAFDKFKEGAKAKVRP